MASSYSDELKQDNKWHAAVLIKLKDGFYITSSLEAAEKEIGDELAQDGGAIEYMDAFFNWNNGTPQLRIKQ